MRRSTEIALAVAAALICWFDVSWALRPGLFPMLDEIGTHALVESQSYRQILHLFPTEYYSDRPLGWAFLKVMAGRFGFDYHRQVAFLIAIHFANCALAFFLFRRGGVGVPLSLAGVALFGGLWTTAQTATYLGESFDVICLFFLLASFLAALSDRVILSALLFLAALRSKEFAILAPIALTALLALRRPRKRLVHGLARRVWPHCAILIGFGILYARMRGAWLATLPPGNSWRTDFRPMAVLNSLSYYASLVFGADNFGFIPPLLLGIALAALFGWAIVRRQAGIAFGLAAYVLFALPVLVMPGTRQATWIYAPQLFLILALCLLGDVLTKTRWTAAICIAIACIAWLVVFRRSSYFRDRVHWTIDVRRASSVTARDADAKLSRLSHGTRVYIRHSADVQPWLFIAGPCSYLQVINRDQSIACVLDDADFAADRAPKVLIEYRADGSMQVIGSTPRR